jgi:hypothetical protein
MIGWSAIYWAVGFVVWLLVGGLEIAGAAASGWEFPLASPLQLFCYFLVPWAAAIVTASTLGTGLGMLAGPVRTRTQRTAGAVIAVVLAIFLPWASSQGAASLHGDLVLTMNEHVFVILVVPVVSLAVSLAVFGIWGLVSRVEFDPSATEGESKQNGPPPD